MNGKVIIVTGGSSGMGKAMAARFVQLGASVVITGRTPEKLEAAQREITAFSDGAGRIHTVTMDVRQPEDAVRMVQETLQAYGQIDALVNNAAGNFLCPAESLSVNGWNAVIQIVLNGTFFCSQAVGKHWIATGTSGAILNMVATYAWDAGPGAIHSACAKAGVLAMTRTLAVEWGRAYGIRVNAIAPGMIERTGGAERLVPNLEAGEQLKHRIPMGRFGTPEEIAGLAAFLLSPDGAYVNGACYTMDGGASLQQTFI